MITSDQISRQNIAGAKRSLPATKRLRSNLPRRKRAHLLPVTTQISKPDPDASHLLKDSSSSCLQSEISVDSTLRSTRVIQKSGTSEEFRRVTRLYAKKQKREISENSNQNAAISEISCVDSISEAKLIAAAESSKQNAAISEYSCAESIYDAISSKIRENSYADSISVRKTSDADQVYDEYAEYNKYEPDSDLVCSEKFSEEYSNSSSKEMTLSEFEAEIFYNSEKFSSDYSLSELVDSSDSNFSAKSSENSAPSVAFGLFRQFAKQFVKSEKRRVNLNENPNSQEFSVLRFESEEDEESYKTIRMRERREVMLYDFGEDYGCDAEFGDLILEQRLLMVNWMVEYSKTMQLHHETLFLGVSLMDRFLSRGYLQSERNLQLLGIASVTLATRLEEVQPGNSIRCRSFTVESNVYTRSEVVAMEWLLLEVINFQCMIPTTHNFLWFYLKAAKADVEVESLSRYLAVLSLLDHERLSFWPSTVAAGLVILACLATNKDSSCLRVMETHVRARSDDLPECIKSLEWLIKYTG